MVQTQGLSGYGGHRWTNFKMKESILNLPNLLTLSRIVLTPFIVYAILLEQPWLSLGLMLIAGVSDLLDGAIAKRLGQNTVVGSYMDPIADKLLLIGCITALFIVNQVPLFLFLAVIFRDVIIVGGALTYELVTHRLKMEPTFLSKATTVAQILYVLVVMFHMAYSLPSLAMQAAHWATFMFTVMSGIHYMVVWSLKAVRAEG